MRGFKWFISFFAAVIVSTGSFGFADYTIQYYTFEAPKPKVSCGKYDNKVTIKFKRVKTAVRYEVYRAESVSSGGKNILNHQRLVWSCEGQVPKATMIVEDACDYRKVDELVAAAKTLDERLFAENYDLYAGDHHYVYYVSVYDSNGKRSDSVCVPGYRSTVKAVKPTVKGFGDHIRISIKKRKDNLVRRYMVYRHKNSKEFNDFNDVEIIGHMYEDGGNMVYDDYDVDFNDDCYYWIGYNTSCNIPAYAYDWYGGEYDVKKVSKKANLKIKQAKIEFWVGGKRYTERTFHPGMTVDVWMFTDGNPYEPTDISSTNNEGAGEVTWTDKAHITLGKRYIKGRFAEVVTQNVNGKVTFKVKVGSKTCSATLKVSNKNYIKL